MAWLRTVDMRNVVSARRLNVDMTNELTRIKVSMAMILWIILKESARHTKINTHLVNKLVLIVYTIRILMSESVLGAM